MILQREINDPHRIPLMRRRVPLIRIRGIYIWDSLNRPAGELITALGGIDGELTVGGGDLRVTGRERGVPEWA